MKKYIIGLLFGALVSPSMLAAQDILTLDSAIVLALKQNLGLQMSQNEVAIAKNNAVKANAGFAPTVTTTANLTPSVGYINQQFFDGRTIERANLSNNISAGVQMSWTLYDGRRMYFTYDRLKETQAATEVSLKIRAEQLVAAVMRAYYNVLRQKELYTATKETMSLYEERLRLAQTRLEVGKGNQLDVLQAQSDLNVQKTQLIRLEQAEKMAILVLKQLLTEGGDKNFVLQEGLTLNDAIDFAALKSEILAQNPSILLLRKQAAISTLAIKEAESQKKPRITWNSAANVGRVDNTAGQFILNQSVGVNTGLALSYPIYDAGAIKRQTENAKIDLQSANLRLQQAQFDIEAQLNMAYQNYQNALELLKNEVENQNIAKQSIDIAMERYRLSRSTILELKQIQIGYETAVIRAVSAKYDAKLAEIDMLSLTGSLLK